MFVIVDKKATIFHRKKDSKTYFVKEDDTHFFYNVSFYVDMESVLKTKLSGIDVYATKFESEGSYTATATIFERMQLDDSDRGVAALLNYERADVANYLFEANKIPRTYVTQIDAKVNFDNFKYKNNRNGTEKEKYGTELTKTAEMIESQGDHFTGTVLSEQHAGPQPGVIRSVGRRVVSEGLRNGRGLIEIMSYGSMKSKSRLDSHVITVEEQENKEYGVKRKVLAEDASIKSQFEGTVSKNGVEEVVSLRKESRRFMLINHVVKIPKKALDRAGIALDKFALAFEAIDLTGVVTLDTNVVEVNLQRDRKYSMISLKKIQVKSGNSTTGDVSFLINSQQEVSMKLNFYHKCLAADVPLLSNVFYPAGRSSIVTTRKAKRDSHEFQLTRKVKNNPTSRVSCFVPPVLTSPQVIRITPTIAGVSFDNCLESAFTGEVTQKANTVPFYVISEKDSPSGPRNTIIVHLDQIDPDIIKIRPVKKDVGKSPYASSRKYRAIIGQSGSRVRYEKVAGKSSQIFYDYDVEDGNTYDYRLELIRKPKNAQRTFSSNNFIEKYEKRDGSINLSLTSSTTSPKAVTINIRATVSPDFRTSAFGLISALEQSLGSQSRDISFFQEELQEIKDSASVAIVLIAERINNTTGEVSFLGNLTGRQLPDQSYTYVLADSPEPEDGNYRTHGLKNKGYTYKFTPCSATIAETISAIKAELETRQGAQLNKKLNLYNFANLKNKLQTVVTDDLVTLSTIYNKYTGSQKRHVLVDAETQSAKDNGQILASASTGDILYFNTGPLPLKTQSQIDSLPGMTRFKKGNILYYPCLKESKQPINKFNNSKISHKFIIEFSAIFDHDIDHVAIFSFTNNKLNYECTLHPIREQKNYRALVEKETFASYRLGNVSFYMFCVKKTGKVLQPQFLGNYAI